MENKVKQIGIDRETTVRAEDGNGKDERQSKGEGKESYSALSSYLPILILSFS